MVTLATSPGATLLPPTGVAAIQKESALASARARLSQPPDTHWPGKVGSTVDNNACLSCGTLRIGLAESNSAQAPDTCGVAIEVPLNFW